MYDKLLKLRQSFWITLYYRMSWIIVMFLYIHAAILWKMEQQKGMKNWSFIFHLTLLWCEYFFVKLKWQFFVSDSIECCLVSCWNLLILSVCGRYTHVTLGWDCVFGTATRYGLDGPGIGSQWGQDIPHPSQLDLGPTQPPIQWGPGLFPGGKRSGHGVDHPPYLVPRLKKE